MAIDILNNTYVHPIYGEYKVIEQAESKNNVRYYKIKFINSGYETVAKSQHIRNLLVRDKTYYKNDIINQTFINTKNQSYKVLNIDAEKDGYFYIMFHGTGTVVSRKRNNIIEGLVYDNKGNTLSTLYDFELNKKVKRRSYTIYKAMLNREKTRNSVVCDAWKLSFDNFYSWLRDIELPKHDVSIYDFDTYKKLNNWALDKDLKGNERVYSPDTCCLLPNKFNQDLYYYQNCNIVVKNKDGNKSTIGNLFNFLKTIGYEIDIENSIKINS